MKTIKISFSNTINNSLVLNDEYFNLCKTFKNEKEFLRMYAIKSNKFNDLIKKMKRLLFYK